MAKIVFSAHWCNPYGFSEHLGSFKWIEILLKKHSLTVFTGPASETGILDYFDGKLPSNLELLSFNDKNSLEKYFSSHFHFSFFTFNKNVKRYIKKNQAYLDNFDVVVHKSPSSFRYRTNVYKINKPLLLGPLGGGLQVPAELREYFKNEKWLQKLRRFDKYLFYLPRYKRLYTKTKSILISFDYLKNTLPKKYHHKTYTILNTGIEMSNTTINRKRSDSEIIKILYIGRLERYKGAELAIRALSKLKAENFHFDIVGGGTEMNLLRNLAKELNLEDKISFIGNVPKTEVGSFYKEADIFCFPSVTEAGGTVFLEAMSYSLPIVSINNGGPKYLCPDEGTLRVEINTPEVMVEDIANKLERLIASNKLRNEMGRVNFFHCKSNYSWEAMEEKILNIFSEYDNLNSQ